MRLVIDTDVLVAAMRSPTGASAELLVRVLNGQATPLVSVALALEYESACTRPMHLAAAGITKDEAIGLIDYDD